MIAGAGTPTGITAPLIGTMCWRIGDLLDIHDQLAWVRDAGFNAIGLHASAGVPGTWRGVEPAECSSRERQRLRRELASFRHIEIHAPFAIELTSGTLEDAVRNLAPTMSLAADLGASVITVHGRPPEQPDAVTGPRWSTCLAELDALAAAVGLRIGIETTTGFGTIAAANVARVGITLDIGHMFLDERGRNELEIAGGLGRLVVLLQRVLVHVHVHDVVDGVDHCELGTGDMPLAAFAEAIGDIGYNGGLCLELNPDRVTPTGIVRSKELLERSLQNSLSL